MRNRLITTAQHRRLYRAAIEIRSLIEKEWQTNLAGLLIKSVAYPVYGALLILELFSLGNHRNAFPELYPEK